jgi:hypothetical protein
MHAFTQKGMNMIYFGKVLDLLWPLTHVDWTPQ